MSAEQSLPQKQMLNDVLHGLSQPQKMLPSKYFYDERGSELFEEITGLPEYYPTRTEKKILNSNIDEIVSYIGQKSVLIEPGSGSSSKTRLLLDHTKDLAAYVPVEISEDYLMETVQNLKQEYPGLLIKPVCADYTAPFQIPKIDCEFNSFVIFYPGSTIGNFEPSKAKEFLKVMASLLNNRGHMLIGVDLKKDKNVLEAAYNDAEGVTAEFNKNMLVRLNRELDTDFDVSQFRHQAFWNEAEGRIEMHLISEARQEVKVDGQIFKFEKNESIHTENSYKYTINEFKELFDHWFEVEKIWTDDKNWFSLQYLVKK